MIVLSVVTNDAINYMHNTIIEENIGFNNTGSVVQGNVTWCAIEVSREGDITEGSEVSATVIGKSVSSNVGWIINTFN